MDIFKTPSYAILDCPGSDEPILVCPEVIDSFLTGHLTNKCDEGFVDTFKINVALKKS